MTVAKARVCRCGHLRAEHNGTVGPNSIGQYWFGTCTHGYQCVDLGYRTELIGSGCDCSGFAKRHWWQR